MTFLNALMLFGLAAASIPILIHLFHRQRVSTVDFSSISFIKHLNLHQSRALKLRQLIILLIRTLIILLAVLAFARPAVRGTLAALLGNGVHQKTAAAVILDNSYGMGAGAANQSAFTQAKETGLRILNLLHEGDESVMILTADPPKAVPERPILGLDRVRAAMERTIVSSRAGDVGASLTLASSLLAGTTAMNKDIYLITDLQRNDWQSLLDATAPLRIDPSVHVSIIPVAPTAVSNASIDAVTVGGGLNMTQQPESIIATITNRDTAPMRNRNVNIYINGVKRGAQTVNVEPGKTGSVRFGLTLNDPGHYAGYVELDNDDLMVDNRRYFTLTIPKAIDVLVVAESESGYFLRQVLSPSDAMRIPLNVKTASASVLSEDRLDHAQVVVIDGELALSGAQLTSLDRFVIGGGGLIVFLGGGVDPSSYNTSLLPKIFACTIQGRIGAPGQRQSYVSMGAIDYDHPIFDVFQRRSGALPDSPRFFASYRLALDPGARVLARFSDDVPAIVEGRHGRGKALLIASTLNTQWSDLPLKSMFVPLIHRGVRYVYADFNASDIRTFTGQPVERVVAWDDADAPITLTLPSESTERLKPTVSNGAMSIVVPHPDDPGIYRIQSDNRILDEFAVNVDTQESDRAGLTEQEVREALAGTDLHFLDPSAGFERELFQSQQGYEIWKLLLWMVLGLIVIESLLTRLPSKGKGAEGLRPGGV